jgi:hypothetical protein
VRGHRAHPVLDPGAGGELILMRPCVLHSRPSALQNKGRRGSELGILHDSVNVSGARENGVKAPLVRRPPGDAGVRVAGANSRRIHGDAGEWWESHDGHLSGGGRTTFLFDLDIAADAVHDRALEQQF